MTSQLTRQRLQSLRELITPKTRGRWLVLTHDNPDPDALASAAVLGKILRQHFHQQVTLAYGGIIGRAENQAMVRSLRLHFSRARRLNLKNYNHYALVDAQPKTGNHQLPDKITPAIVIDHHPVRKATLSVPFYDIRVDYGATATILAEYLLESGIKPTTALATAVVYAIRSETQDFAREFTGPDKAIYDTLLLQANPRRLARIQNAALPVGYFRNVHEALERLETVGNLIVSHLGEIEQPDIVPEIADLLLRMEGKTWSLCSGIFGDRIYLSIRTSNPQADAGRIMRRLVGRRGKGGGHGMIAGGWVATDRSPGGDPKALQRQLAERLAKSLKRDPKKLAPLYLQST